MISREPHRSGATMLMKHTTACAKSKLPTDSMRVSATSFIIAHKVKNLRHPRFANEAQIFSLRQIANHRKPEALRLQPKLLLNRPRQLRLLIPRMQRRHRLNQRKPRLFRRRGVMPHTPWNHKELARLHEHGPAIGLCASNTQHTAKDEEH